MSAEQQFPGEASEFVKARLAVFFDPKLQAPNVPYEINFNVDQFIRLLKDLNLSDDQIQNTTIVLDTESNHSLIGSPVYGRYKAGSNSINIYCNPLWDIYEKQVASATRIALNPEKRIKTDEKRLNSALYTQRLPNYLRTAPPERSIPYARSLLKKASHRNNSGVILHEVQHMLDTNYHDDKKAIALMIGEKAAIFVYLTGMGVLLIDLDDAAIITALNATLLASMALALNKASYAINPLELKARRFEKENRSKPEYRDILTFSYKANTQPRLDQ